MSLCIHSFVLNIIAFPSAARGFLRVPSGRAGRIVINPQWTAAEPFDASLVVYTSAINAECKFARIACTVASMN